jgi:Trypsin-like peptidase domain
MALETSVVRVLDGESALGAGVLISEMRVLSAAHVIAGALQISPDTSALPEGQVCLDFPLLAPGLRIPAQVILWRPSPSDSPVASTYGEDIAVLQLMQSAPQGAQPAEFVESHDFWNHRFRTFGFPQGHNNGVWAEGFLKAPRAGGYVQVIGESEPGYFVARGFSGSPVWDHDLGGIVGIIATAEINPLIKGGFMIPIQLVASAAGESQGYFSITRREEASVPQFIRDKLDDQGDALASYSDYKQTFEQDLSRKLPSNREIEFDLSISPEGEEKDPVERLLVEAEEKKTLVLRGYAGGGKSSLLRGCAERLWDRGILPIFLNLKDWDISYSEGLEMAISRGVKIDEKWQELLKVSLGQLNPTMDEDLYPLDRFIIVDGLNELYGEEITRQLLKLLVSYAGARRPKKTFILVSDRSGSRTNLGDGWYIVELKPLSAETVQRIVSSSFGEGNYEDLPESDRELLSIPFFLNHALQKGSLYLGSAAQAVESFFIEQLGFDTRGLDCLAESAFNAYSKDRSSSFSAAAYKERIGEAAWETLRTSGTVRNVDKERVQFDHQLKHDYLASRYLAQNEACWNWSSFDAVSFESQSFESLSMAFEQIKDSIKGDRFLTSLYDWNWVATVTAMIDAIRAKNECFTPEMQMFVMASVSEKAVDSMTRTRYQARRELSKFPEEIAGAFLKADSIERVIALVNDLHSDEQWFESWRRLFTRDHDPAMTEAEIQQIAYNDPILGWTASNVIRRSSQSEDGFRQLRSIYMTARDSEDAHYRTVRWRVLHSLGVSDSQTTVDLLFDAVDSDGYHWAKYGAARSLMDIAARTKGDSVRKYIIENLKLRLKSLHTKALEGVQTGTFNSQAPDSWRDEVLPLLQSIKAERPDHPGLEGWLRGFEKFWNERNKA